ncbi:prenyltransferase/squalene oxidase repeat-containing protein [Streptomyces sp. V3I8]|uniref:prenyltransferase/squalene oxidase repeat-containing protein n=1 Tax=Streptomyces sp. V3I8 TaxID=3042279 RepID=UPI0027D88285|nr:prenyltransferase/squalene oxidase repeat-containing protein [Streptomyces sp. V3I8]
MTEAEKIVRDIGGRTIASTAYTTAWAARMTTPDGQEIFPRARHWLTTHQHPDGSWGSDAVHNPYDRLVSTLAAITALNEASDAVSRRAVHAGVDFLEHHAVDWRGAPGETVGFEVAAPFLLEQARRHGLDVSVHGEEELHRLRADKLATVVDSGALLREPTSLLYSVEALTDLVPAQELARFTLPNGSLADSPSSTIALWQATRDPAALWYLCSAARSTDDGGMPEVHGFDVMEPAWALYTLARAGLKPPSATAHIARLETLGERSPAGLAMSAGFQVADSDDTSMAANVLHAYHRPTRPLLEALTSFVTDTHVACYPHERGLTVTVNARALEAFAPHPDIYAEEIRTALGYLLDVRKDGAWWVDKWHTSPYYATAQAAFACALAAPHEMAAAWQWLLDSQHPDGSWGTGAGPAEETGHAVLALNALEPHFGPALTEVYQRAHTQLCTHLNNPDLPALWIAKTLYTPVNVVRAVILSAHTIAVRRAGQTPARCAVQETPS